MKISEFNRKRLTEFVKDLSREVKRIEISISPDGDKAILYLPFGGGEIKVYEGEKVLLGDVIPGSNPALHTISTQNAKL